LLEQDRDLDLVRFDASRLASSLAATHDAIGDNH